MATANDLNISQAGYVVFDGTATFTGRTFQAGTGVTLTNASGVAGNTTISASASVPTTFTGNSGTATPALNNLNILTANSTVKFVGSGSTLTQDFGLTNLILGNSASSITSGDFNTGLGKFVFNSLVSGGQNVAIGLSALQSNISSSNNTAVGYLALGNYTGTGTGANIAIGNSALSGGFTGTNNIGIGNSVGNYSGTESSNIVIGTQGLAGDNNSIKIGTQGSGSGQQNTCYIAGIVGVTVSNAQVVTINSSTGQLGVSASGMAWTDVTTSTQTIAVDNGYITDRGAGVTYTLPSTASLGDTIKIDGKLGLTTITPNANQQILMGSVSGTVGVTGTAVATNVGDCIQLRCITSGVSTVWRAENWVGNWTLS